MVDPASMSKFRNVRSKIFLFHNSPASHKGFVPNRYEQCVLPRDTNCSNTSFVSATMNEPIKTSSHFKIPKKYEKMHLAFPTLKERVNLRFNWNAFHWLISFGSFSFTSIFLKPTYLRI